MAVTATAPLEPAHETCSNSARTTRIFSSTWCAYLAPMSRKGVENESYINGRRLNETQTRYHYRWTRECEEPLLQPADDFMVHVVGDILDLFLLDWAEDGGLPIWVSGRPPAFESRRLDEHATPTARTTETRRKGHTCAPRCRWGVACREAPLDGERFCAEHLVVAHRIRDEFWEEMRARSPRTVTREATATCEAPGCTNGRRASSSLCNRCAETFNDGLAHASAAGELARAA